MENNDNQQKNPWSIFSDIDGREIFELLDTQQVRAMTSASALAPHIGSQPYASMSPYDGTEPHSPVARNREEIHSGGNTPYPAFIKSSDPYASHGRDSSANEIPRGKASMPLPDTNGGYQTQTQPPMPPQYPQANSAYVQNDGLPHLQTLSPTPRFDIETMVIETGVPAMTIRAWERKYSVPSPWRGGNSYTVYSSRDVVAVR